MIIAIFCLWLLLLYNLLTLFTLILLLLLFLIFFLFVCLVCSSSGLVQGDKKRTERAQLNSADGDTAEFHDQFYRDHKLLLVLFRALAVMPITRSRPGKSILNCSMFILCLPRHIQRGQRKINTILVVVLFKFLFTFTSQEE